MLDRLRFRWFFRRSEFASALACREPGKPLGQSDDLFACYRLGLYETVASSRRLDNNWRGAFAMAVSLAACGRSNEAEELVHSLAARDDFAEHRVSLASALAPYLPRRALALIAEVDAPAGLRAALLMRVGQRAATATILRDALRAGPAGMTAELNLYLSNAEPHSPAEKLERMNAFLAAFWLPPLALRDDSLPPGATNLCAATSQPICRGPLVSILMTAYQSGKRIGSAIASLLGQSYRDIELIVVDDASTDDTRDVVCALAATDSRINYVRLPCNVGTYVAKRIGLGHARGEFVTCHDSDDWAHPLKIERQVRPLLEDSKLVFTSSQWVRLQDDGTYFARPVHPMMRHNPASPLFRRHRVLDQMGPWDSVRTGADTEFHARLKLTFGRRAQYRLRQPMTFGAHRQDSLMTAAETGFGEAGLSATRLNYLEAWTHWHVSELRHGRLPRMPTDLLADRPFAAPGNIAVSRPGIDACLQSCAQAGQRIAEAVCTK